MRSRILIALILLVLGMIVFLPVARSGQGDCTSRADLNGDSKVNVADAVYLLQYLFREGPPIQCEQDLDLSLDVEHVTCFPGGGTPISLLVRIGEGLTGPVTLTPALPDALRFLRFPSEVEPCTPARFILAVDLHAQEGTYRATIRARAGEVIAEKEITAVVEGPASDTATMAHALRRAAFEFLRDRHPLFLDQYELPSADDAYQAFVPCPETLIVSYCVLLHESWQIVCSWHVMVPPHDWKRVSIGNADEEIYWACEFDTDDVPREIPYVKPFAYASAGE